MRKILPVLLIALFSACTEHKQGSGELTDYLPQDSAVILHLQNPDLFFSNLQNNEFLKINEDRPLYLEIQNKTSVLKYFPHKKEALLALTTDQVDNSIDFTFIGRGNITTIPIDSLQNVQVETFTAKDYKITKYILEGQTAFSTLVDSVTILSSSRKILEESIRATYTPSPDLTTAFKAASQKSPSIFINHDKASSILNQLLPLELPGLSHWTVLDTDLSQSDIILNGISVAGDSSSRLINSFRGVGVATNSIASVTPVAAKGFTSVSFRNSEKFLQQLQPDTSLSQPAITSERSLIDTAIEAGVIQLSENSVFAIKTLDPEAARLSLDFELQQTEEFRGYAIYSNPNTKAFQDIFQPLLKPEDLHYFTFFDTYILYAEKTEALKEVITAVQNELVLANTEAYKASSENLSSEASLLIVRNNQAQNNSSADEFDFKDYPISAIQFIYQDNFAHVHSTLIKSSALKTEKPVAQQAGIDLGNTLSGRPVFFRNHRTKGMDIAVQDIQNILYLISPEGKIHWKKNIGSRILGEVQTVDILRNGRYQLAFATQNELHVIDRDGNAVKPFPLKFRDAITQPVAIFDYDNKRDYRFVITQGREILMYDRKGKSVRGFNFSKAASEIIKPPKHIRIGRKDYILIPESSGRLNILSRTGKIRVPVKEKIDFSENDWYDYNDNFVSTNASGKILKLNEQGSIKTEDLDLAENTRITATAKTLVTLSENQLSIKGNTVTLDFGLYTEPQIFYINNKIYVSVTDLQSQKVYLFDSNAELLNGFPVYGTSTIDLSNADDDNALELVVQGEDDGVVVYEVN
ncbi:hypothetical protein [Salinimicrobium xinjiangense]|uniref:hypothetical protein n=1 Tax=Salinimicrobium xinjiangense TaxID=438596 RepID=UPI0003FD217D|nr:hypothetical protein [Salinimicrobium xinjiangense]